MALRTFTVLLLCLGVGFASSELEELSNSLKERTNRVTCHNTDSRGPPGPPGSCGNPGERSYPGLTVIPKCSPKFELPAK